ncbi:MAG: M56 family metallopeptidase [Cyclobacteriaceae bacterium]
MNWLSEYISEAMIQALGMTFLHSIWQGVLAGFLVSIAFYVVKYKRADLRYNISMGVMVVFFLAVCSTFTIYYERIPDLYTENALPQIELEDQMGISDPTVLGDRIVPDAKMFDAVFDFLSQHADVLVSFWLIGIVLLSVRFAGGFLYIRKLRNTGLTHVPDEWQFKLEELSLSLGLNKLPSFHESSLVTSPIAFGYIKPMILFPLGMLTSMPVQHLDAMLVHELIHVKNSDYLTNLLLSVIEILLFFNPAIWWLSGVIRAEMEHRCDDAAVALTGSKMHYAYALVAMQDNQTIQKSELALGMAKNKSQLTHRVHRLFGTKGERSVSFGRPLISLVVLFTSVLLLAFSSIEEKMADTENDGGLTESVVDSLKNVFYYVNDEIVDINTYNQFGNQPNILSKGYVVGDSLRLMLYTTQSYDSIYGVKKRQQFELSKDKHMVESILLVDGVEKPIDFLRKLEETNSIGQMSLHTDKEAEAISKEYAGKSVWVVTTKKDTSSHQIRDKEIYQGITDDSIGFRYFPKTRTLQTADKSLMVKSIHVPVGQNWKKNIGKSRYGNHESRQDLLSKGLATSVSPNVSQVKFEISLLSEKPAEPDSISEFEQLRREMKGMKFPLVVVDGEKWDDIFGLYPGDVESISVLKGESATEIYGEEGAHGVVLITTKKSRETKHINDTKLNITHTVVKQEGNYYLKGKVVGNITKKNVTDAFIRFDDNWQDTFHTDKNGEFEILIPSGAREAVIRHFMLPSEYVSVDVKKNESNLSRLRLEKTLKVHPNPTSDIVKIQLSLDEDSESRVMIDIIKLDSKNTVKNLSRKKLKKGVYEFEWDSSKEIAGVYLVVVQNGNERISKKVVVAR